MFSCCSPTDAGVGEAPDTVLTVSDNSRLPFPDARLCCRTSGWRYYDKRSDRTLEPAVVRFNSPLRGLEL